jgi:hypothetical protein
LKRKAKVKDTEDRSRNNSPITHLTGIRGREQKGKKMTLEKCRIPRIADGKAN